MSVFLVSFIYSPTLSITIYLVLKFCELVAVFDDDPPELIELLLAIAVASISVTLAQKVLLLKKHLAIRFHLDDRSIVYAEFLL